MLAYNKKGMQLFTYVSSHVRACKLGSVQNGPAEDLRSHSMVISTSTDFKPSPDWAECCWLNAALPKTAALDK